MNEKTLKYKDQIRKLVPINGLPAQYQNEVINRSRVQTYRKRQFVFRQGDRDNHSYYLLEGTLELLFNDQLVKQIAGGSEAARYALAQLQPRQRSAKASSAVTVLQVDRHLLDRLLTLDDKSDAEGEVQVSDIDSEESGDWMTKVLQSELFARIPAANIQKIFTTMESVQVSAGEVVVEQGTAGDYYYLVQSGRCEVLRRSSSSAEPIRLAELGEGDTFGEEALVADATRNASIVMLTEGELMRLTKSDFIDLIRDPVLESVSYLKAESLVAGGAKWLDVRFPEEHQQSGIQGSLNVPLNVLRIRQRELDPDTRYVIYCDTGGRSSVAAFLLTQGGFDVCYLHEGLLQTPLAPDLKVSAGTSSARGTKARSDKQTQGATAARAEAQAAPATDGDPIGEQLEPTIRASVLDTELARANLQLEQALKQKREAEDARKSAEERARKRIEAERDKLGAEAKRLRDEAEAAKRRLAEAVKGQILQERGKLEAEAKRLKDEALAATRAAEEIAEQRIQQERERLESKAERANEALEEAKRLKREIEAARQAALAEAAELRRREEEKIQKLREEAERRLHEESAKLEAEYARNAAELERVRREREEAEARLRHERSKMEEQTADARRKLEEARRMKQETEASRRAVEMEVEQKRREQEELERRLRGEVDKKIREERRKLEAEFARHAQEMEKVQREREAAEAARIAAQEEAERIIAEYKAEHDRTVAEHEAKLREERARIELEAKSLQEALEEARRAREQAEATQRAVEARMQELRQAEAKAAKSRRDREEEHVQAELAAMDAEVNEAMDQLRAAERAHQAAQAAKRANQARMDRHRDAETQLRAQLELEAQQWREEQERMEREGGRARDLLMEEHIERIKRRAAEAKRRAREANSSLLNEIATQLIVGER